MSLYSPDTPSLKSGSILWQDAQNINNTFPATQPANSAAVASFKNRAGFRQDYVQATGGNKPTYEESGANSKPVIRFNGVSSYLQSSDGIVAPANMTLFMVLTPSVTTAYALATTGGPGDSPAIICNFDPGDGNKDFEWFAGAERFTLKDTGANAGLNIISITRENNGGAFSSWFNGALAATGTASGDATGNIFTGLVSPFGGWYQGDMAELIIYDTLLSDSDRQQVEAYLSNKWGVAI